MKLDQILEELGDTDEGQWLRRCLDEGASNLGIANALTRAGHDITEASVRRWKDRREHASG